MLVLGVDPGTIITGYGLVECGDGETALIECGAVRAPAKNPIERRLWLVHTGIRAIIQRARPDVIAIEEPFVVRAPRRAALAVGEARAAVMIAAAEAGAPIFQYPPAKVKQAVAGYGGGDKEQVRRMVEMITGADLSEHPLDVSDAIAVALCHSQEATLLAMAAAAPPETAR